MVDVIVLLISHFSLMFLAIANAVITNNNVIRILWTISTICWTLLFINDIFKLVQM